MEPQVTILQPRKNNREKKPAQSYDEIRRKQNADFRKRIKPVGRSLSELSIENILSSCKRMGCTALFDLGAGSGLVLKKAEQLGFQVVGGIEIDAGLSGSNPDIFTTSFADFDRSLWLNRINRLNQKPKTLFYIYEGGLWDPSVCQQAVNVVNSLASQGDLVCVITHTGTVAVKSSWNIEDWGEKLSRVFLLGIMPVYGDEQNGQREIQKSYLFTVKPPPVTGLRF